MDDVVTWLDELDTPPKTRTRPGFFVEGPPPKMISIETRKSQARCTYVNPSDIGDTISTVNKTVLDFQFASRIYIPAFCFVAICFIYFWRKGRKGKTGNQGTHLLHFLAFHGCGACAGDFCRWLLRRGREDRCLMIIACFVTSNETGGWTDGCAVEVAVRLEND